MLNINKDTNRPHKDKLHQQINQKNKKKMVIDYQTKIILGLILIITIAVISVSDGDITPQSNSGTSVQLK